MYASQSVNVYEILLTSQNAAVQIDELIEGMLTAVQCCNRKQQCCKT